MISARKLEAREGPGMDSRAPQPRPSARPMSSVLAEKVLADVCLDAAARPAMALAMLKGEISSRGGRLDVVETPQGMRVDGEVIVPAGGLSKSSMVRVGLEGRTGSMVVERAETLDEKIANAVLGYGAGALDVSYRVSGSAASYVIRTNGSQACQEGRLVDVAMSLAGAAEIVEAMLERVAAAESSEPKEPVQPMRPLRKAA